MTNKKKEIDNKATDKMPCNDLSHCELGQFYKERTEYLEDLVKKYKFDFLTGLMGKLDYTEKVNMMFEEYRFAEQDFIFVLIDIDNLHNLNRIEGYHYGDRMIQDLSSSLLSHFEFHQVYRVSGDEFAVLIRNYQMTEADIATKLDGIKGITYVIDSAKGYTNPKHMFKAADKKLTEKKVKVDRV